MAALQILVSGVTLFVLYKYLIYTLGIELIGVWSIVMAFSAFLRTGDFGFAGSIVKFISTSITKNETQKVLNIITTSFTSVAVILGALLLVFYPILNYLLSFFIEIQYLSLAQELLPYSLISVWFAVLGTLTIFIFDGINRVDLRSIFLVIFNLILVGFSILFVHIYGFIGLGYAQVLHSLLLLLTAWILVRKYLKIKFILPFAWNKHIFKEMFSYSMHLQMSSIMAMMLEPVSKLLLGYFGNLSSVGYFEMANRLVMQVRNVIVNANQALVPMLSKEHTENTNSNTSFIKIIKVLFVLSLFSYSTVALLTPLISQLWIGTYQEQFTNYTYIILFALAINTIAGSAYFINMSTGDVKYNTYSQIIIAFFSIFLGIILGYLYTSTGIVISYTLSIIIGSLWLILNFIQRNNDDKTYKINS